jgi:four helix bundle protein
MQRELCDRTKAFAVRVVHLVSALPPNRVSDVLGRQVLRAGTSVGAHCREGYRSRSKAELISKLEVALQELDETTYWFELLKESGAVKPERLTALEKEADEIIRVMVTAVRTMKRKS